MSTTDTRAAFEAEIIKHFAFAPELFKRFDGKTYFSDPLTFAWIGWQAATEAAKATGTAGELPPLPEAHDVYGPHGWLECYTADQMREYGQACAAMARGAAVRDYIENGAEAARQPAPVVSSDLRNAAQLIMDLYDDMRMGKESIPAFDALRAALAATAAPVLSDERIDWLANCACPGGVAYPSQVKAAIRDALREASTNKAQP